MRKSAFYVNSRIEAYRRAVMFEDSSVSERDLVS